MNACLCKNSSAFPPEKNSSFNKGEVVSVLLPEATIRPLASGKLEHIKMCCSLEIRLLLFAEGRAGHLQGITLDLKQARTVGSMEDCRPLLFFGEINICSTASAVLSLSFL